MLFDDSIDDLKIGKKGGKTTMRKTKDEEEDDEKESDGSHESEVTFMKSEFPQS